MNGLTAAETRVFAELAHLKAAVAMRDGRWQIAGNWHREYVAAMNWLAMCELIEHQLAARKLVAA